MGNTNYVVLARKWRPAQFSDIVGQTHVVRTLSNAIRSERIHQAYLFTGSRGIGKTSIARIFAKAIRCESAKREGDWIVSCDVCASCREIASGNGVDVIEIDGASNNGVEAVREIRENAKYLPSVGARKIYIIDEVHMLTTAAFNALLKTLEEPPPHVIFIFATTEPHKIPATILSRCQRFDFRRVNVTQIQERLAEVALAEGVQAETAALAVIARAAEGGMRDALSLLDQAIAFSGNQISVQSVRDSIGLIEGQTILAILSGIFQRKPLDSLALVEQAYHRGHDLRVLTRGLIEFLHGAILAKVGATGSAVLELSEEEWKELVAVAQLRSLEEIELIFQVFHLGLDWIARSPQPRVVLDVLVVKCATAEALVEVGGNSKTPEKSAAPVKSATSATSAISTPAATSASITISAPAKTLAPVSAPATASATSVVSAPSPDVPQTKPISTVDAALNQKVGPTWEGFIALVRKSRPLLASILEHGGCISEPATGRDELAVSYKPEEAYYKEQLQSRVYQEQSITLAREYYGRPIRILIDLKDSGESIATKKDRVQKQKESSARDAAQNHPIIREAKALFGGNLGPIELTEDKESDHA